LDLQTNKSLLSYNTFGIDVSCKFFVELNKPDSFQHLITSDIYRKEPRMVLGGGSNILFTKDYEGIVLHNQIKGIEVVSENDEHVTLKVGAGENWHELVLWSIKRNYGGFENLSLIPGNVGASPMQNIGAYGVEIKDLVKEVHYLNLETGEPMVVTNENCQFGYRTSIFKTELKNKILITHVVYELNKEHQLNTSYGAIEEELKRMEVNASIQTVSQAVINIRRSKLPDPVKIGNAGSFFKNPVVEPGVAEELKSKFPDMPTYPSADGIKIAAGWLIEKAGWKGKKMGNYGVHEKQALVLVNYGGAQGNAINDLSEQIRTEIKGMFNIELEKEVNII
jgi:UDP-N-acetylmuramate dehydrogenase